MSSPTHAVALAPCEHCGGVRFWSHFGGEHPTEQFVLLTCINCDQPVAKGAEVTIPETPSHDEQAGYYVLCHCEFCTEQKRRAQVSHAQTCERERTRNCAQHGLEGCHCDCRK